MVLEDHPTIKKHLDENESIEVSQANEDKMREHLDKIKKVREKYINNNNKKLEETKLAKDEKEEVLLKKENLENLNEELLEKLIIEKGSKEVSYWARFKYLIILGSILFLVVLYFIFWYIADKFPIVEESFTTLFCLI